MGYNEDLLQLKESINRLRFMNSSAQRFVPEGRLAEVISKDVVLKVLSGLQKSSPKDVVEFILRSAVKVFAVLVLIDHPERIEDFIQGDQFRDHQLDYQGPFSKEELSKKFQDEYFAELFEEKQWEFWTPTFSGHVSHRSLAQSTILPYVSEKHLDSGGFGTIYKIEIHPSHYPPGFTDVKEFVRKELAFEDTTFENEARILSTLQRLKHPGILPLVSCYTYKSKHNLVSPFVEGGNLKMFLKRERAPNMRREDLLLSISGLASALWALHEFTSDDSELSFKGLHQDLTPDNILVNGSRFVLADFGLSSIKDLSSNSQTPFKGRRGYCQAPECTNLSKPYEERTATRKTDIFALACIIVDLLVYFYKGPSGVNSFKEAREFHVSPMCYCLYHKGDKSNEAVVAMLQDISHNDSNESTREVVKLTGEISPAQRPTAAIVTTTLYISTIRAYCEAILVLLSQLPSVWAVKIEKLRLLSWLTCQDVQLFLSMPGVTATNTQFEATVGILRKMREALEVFEQGTPFVDKRSLSEVRMLNTQLLSTLPLDYRARSKSQLDSLILIAIAEAKNSEFSGLALEIAFGPSRITEMAQRMNLVEDMNDKTPVPGKPYDSVEGYGKISTVLPFRTIPASQLAKIDQYRKRETFCYPDQRSPKRPRRDHIDRAMASIPCGVRKASWCNGEPGRKKPLLFETIRCYDPYGAERVLPRCHALCTLLSSQSLSRRFRTLPFFALCAQKNYSYDLVYEYPETQGSEERRVKPISLLELVSNKDEQKYPSLERRLKLASELAEALAAFHDVGWLHKDLTSSNISFFQSVDTEFASRSLDPYLSGFLYSRTVADHDQTIEAGPRFLNNRFTSVPDESNAYHSPEYFHSYLGGEYKPFLREYDWYSLGVVLIEIGMWNSIENIRSKYGISPKRDFWSLLRDYHFPILAFHVGTEYADVVKFCLVGSERSQSSGTNEATLTEQPNLLFKRKVVAPLRDLYSKASREAARLGEITTENWTRRSVLSVARRNLNQIGLFGIVERECVTWRTS